MHCNALGSQTRDSHIQSNLLLFELIIRKLVKYESGLDLEAIRQHVRLFQFIKYNLTWPFNDNIGSLDLSNEPMTKSTSPPVQN